MHTCESGLQFAVVENGVVHLRKSAVVRDLGREVENQQRRQAERQAIATPAVDPGRSQTS
jgi:hypothetical protein